jgi:hypothetical protein
MFSINSNKRFKSFVKGSVVLLIILSMNVTVNAQIKSSKITLISELKQFSDIGILPEYRSNSIAGQVSSYDTTGGNDDGGGKYSFVRKNTDGSLVMLDVKGPGVLNRFATPTPGTDTIDFYIDDMVHPALSIKYSDLFSGKFFPFTAPLCGSKLGGYYCYYPILFQKGCKIVYRGKNLEFHQLQYRLFPSGTTVTPFRKMVNEEEKKALEKINILWSKKEKTTADFYPSIDKKEISTSINIKAGEAASAASLKTGGRILGIELQSKDTSVAKLNNIYIRITWDNETKPAVDCPVADFFGYAFGLAAMQSLLIGGKDGNNYFYFPMPFDEAATIELVYHNKGASQLNFEGRVKIYYTTQKRKQNEEGKFYAYWNKKFLTEHDHYHLLLDVKGKGHYVGTILWAEGSVGGSTVFFEGDDSTIVDGKYMLHGTGSEDYFNGGWYSLPGRWDTAHSLPLHGCLGYSLPRSYTGGYRLLLNDKISFNTSIYQCIEHGPMFIGVRAVYTSLCFYYSDSRMQEEKKP